LFSFLLVTQQACKKEEEKPNQKPTCEITAPTNGQEIKKGETVTISVDATDNDGSIAEVRFFIDDVGQGSVASFPYTYNWNTENESLGNHTIKATGLDNEGGSTSDDVSVTIIEGGSGNTFTDPRDGQAYNIVAIGRQTWMAENLKYLPDVNPSLDGSNSSPYYYAYDYQGTNVSEAKATTNYQTYGVLYNWNAALNACPDGWHLPTDDEWKTLEMYLGMSQSESDDVDWRGTDEGGKLKETGTTNWWSPNTGATNSSGFTALPGGFRYSNGSFYNLGIDGYWRSRSSSESSGTGAWGRRLRYDYSQVGRGTDETSGFSVRCLKD